MRTPRITLRGNQYVADLRAFGGHQYSPLGIGREASPIEQGMALERALSALRAAQNIGAPALPGLESPGLTMAQLAGMYLDGRDYDSKGGERAVISQCKQITKDLGHLTVECFSAPGGETVIRSWRDKLWGRGLVGKTVNNLLYQLLDILEWGQTDQRRLTGPLPRLPKGRRSAPGCRPGERLNNPIFDFWSETDFRILREHWSDDADRTKGWSKEFKGDRAVWEDYKARRRLYLSAGFYLGLHTIDLDALPACWLSVDVGRYLRHNSKSAASVDDIWLDMPEQFQLDCQAELSRLGRLWRVENHRPGVPCDCERVGGGPWLNGCRSLAKATARLFPRASWPEGAPLAKRSTLPLFNFRLARRSTVREYTVRGWSTAEIAAVLGHVDTQMIEQIYRRMKELGLISPVRVPWRIASGPNGGPTRTGDVIPFRVVR